MTWYTCMHKVHIHVHTHRHDEDLISQSIFPKILNKFKLENYTVIIRFFDSLLYFLIPTSFMIHYLISKPIQIINLN